MSNLFAAGRSYNDICASADKLIIRDQSPTVSFVRSIGSKGNTKDILDGVHLAAAQFSTRYKMGLNIS